MNGFIFLHRSMFDNPVVTQSADRIAIWVYLLTHATPVPRKAIFKGKEIVLKPGQLITSRKAISECAHNKISEDVIQRSLRSFETAQQIAQQTSNKNRLITIKNWSLYQATAQQDAMQPHNKSTTNPQQAQGNRTQIDNRYKDNKRIYNNSAIQRSTSSKHPTREELIEIWGEENVR